MKHSHLSIRDRVMQLKLSVVNDSGGFPSRSLAGALLFCALYGFKAATLGVNRALGPKYYNMNGIWALRPYYLGP